MMHVVRYVVVIICLAVTVGTTFAIVAAQDPGTSGEAAAVLSAAREALGGEKRIGAVKTLVTTGRTRQLRGENLVPIEFEINIELPDKYVRRDEFPTQDLGPTSRGFNGDALIQSEPPARGGGPPQRGEGGGPPPDSARGGPPDRAGAPADRGRGPGGPPPNPTTPIKQDFVRLTLGMFATSFSTYPLSFGYAGQAEAPEGKADVLEIKGPSNFAARLFVDSKSHLPLMLSWTTPPNLVPVVTGQSPPANLAPGSVVFETPAPPGPSATPEQRKQFEEEALAARKKAMATAKPTENRIYYADYREVDGLMLPFRIRRAIGATTTEETVFDRFRINTKIDPRKFEVRK
jgi:hypothetical protein